MKEADIRKSKAKCPKCRLINIIIYEKFVCFYSNLGTNKWIYKSQRRVYESRRSYWNFWRM